MPVSSIVRTYWASFKISDSENLTIPDSLNFQVLENTENKQKF